MTNIINPGILRADLEASLASGLISEGIKNPTRKHVVPYA
jgi:hypothetical protein